VQSGKVRYIACSNFSGWALMKSLAISNKYGWPKYIAQQSYYSLIGRDFEWELMPLGIEEKIGTMVWSPLGWVRRTGKLHGGLPLLAPARKSIRSQPRPGVIGCPRVEAEAATERGSPVFTRYYFLHF